MAQRGRKCKYEELIEPKLDEIAARIESGDTKKQVAKDMHISPSIWKEYKKKFPVFLAAIKKAHKRETRQSLMLFTDKQ